MSEIPLNIFNPDAANEIKTNSLFLQPKSGLFDSINRQNQTIFDLYKRMKRLDWDENEFPFTSCLHEFKTCKPIIRDAMIKTIAWQWEADSIIMNSIVTITAPFVSSSDLSAAWSAVGTNELLHALTYSEIVKNSFEHPELVMKDVLEEKNALLRLTTVSKVFNHASIVGAKISLGQVDRDSQEAYDAIFLFVIACLILESIQFMDSFSITFAIADTGEFSPIGKAVQKICADEFTVHIPIHKAVIAHELRYGKASVTMANHQDTIKKMLNEALASEFAWADYITPDERPIAGRTRTELKMWAQYCANPLYDLLKINSDYDRVTKNPLRYMENWIDLNKHQGSPQEEKLGNYFLGGFVDDIGDRVLKTRC